MTKWFFIAFSALLLIYLLWPGPTSINNFIPLPNSLKSTEEGDTIQIPNVAGYYSNNYRDFATKFYRSNYQQESKSPFPAIRLNYPPEFAFTAIKDQTPSTYLEEYVYPLRDSIFVNGMEPFLKNGRSRYWGATEFVVNKNIFMTKVTLRYYPSPIWARFFVWGGIVFSVMMLGKLGKRILFK